VLIEFSYNNDYYSSIGMMPYEVLNAWQYRISLCWQDIKDTLTIGPELIQAIT